MLIRPIVLNSVIKEVGDNANLLRGKRKSMITFETIKNNRDVKNYIEAADMVMDSMGYTDHSYSHLNTVRQRAVRILQAADVDERTIELASIAAHMHDIGICVNRKNHAEYGAMMAFKILTDLGMDSSEVSQVMCAIGNHDEGSGQPISKITAALIIADKSDIRRTRVRKDARENDIHDEVNLAVTETRLLIDKEAKCITLELVMDTSIASVYDLFSIYGNRLDLCNRAAQKLGFTYNVTINELVVQG